MLKTQLEKPRYRKVQTEIGKNEVGKFEQKLESSNEVGKQD